MVLTQVISNNLVLTGGAYCGQWDVHLTQAIRLADFRAHSRFLGLHPTNERWRYSVMTSLIGWEQTQNQPCDLIHYFFSSEQLNCNHILLLKWISILHMDNVIALNLSYLWVWVSHFCKSHQLLSHHYLSWGKHDLNTMSNTDMALHVLSVTIYLAWCSCFNHWSA